MLADAALAPDPVRLGAIERAWTQLTGPGVELTATERHQVIKDARAAWDGAAAPAPASGVSGEAAHWLAIDAEGLSADVITDFETRGLDRWRYLEIVGIVSRLANVDFYTAGLGGARFELPTVDHAMPSGRRDAAAIISNMWVPTVGVAYAPHVLDALPAEGEALRDLHEPMYVNFASIRDGQFADALTKSQIEFLAARTSYLNECFY